MFIGDVKYYGSGGIVNKNNDCSGIRLLAVKPEARKLGVGKVLTNACIQRAKDIGTSQVILHFTRSMAFEQKGTVTDFNPNHIWLADLLLQFETKQH